MHYAVGEPGEDVENRMLVGGENVGEIGAVKNILERRENTNPDMGTVIIGDKATAKEIHQPNPNHRRREEELSSGGHGNHPDTQSNCESLDAGRRGRDPETEESQQREERILKIRGPPLVRL